MIFRDAIQRIDAEPRPVREVDPNKVFDYAPWREKHMANGGIPEYENRRSPVDLDQFAEQIGSEAEKLSKLHRDNQARFNGEHRLADLEEQLKALTYGEMIEFAEGVMTLWCGGEPPARPAIADGAALAGALHKWCTRDQCSSS
jgi:hypothetical protein